MTSRNVHLPEKQLTEVELEMMNIIWDAGPCSVKQMLGHLSRGRQLAYTSVSTIVRILEQKGFVTSRKEGRGHAYAAAISKEAYQAKSLGYLVTRVFNDAPTQLVRQLLQMEDLSAQDLAEIKSLLEKT